MQKGWRYFGLQFYGECWSGPSPNKRYAMYGKSERCVGIDYKPCVDSAETECIGKYSTNYVYELGKEQKYRTVRRWG